jgi:hypothetical protein
MTSTSEGRWNSRMQSVKQRGLIFGRTFANGRPWTEKTIDYVLSRRNPDGGYTFWQDADSNAQDTHFGLAILRLLGAPLPNVEETVKWLRRFEPGNIYSYYYVGRSLLLCGEALDDRFQKYVISAITSKRHFASVDVYVEFASEFQAACMVLELAKLIKLDLNGNEMLDWLLRFKNRDGGFGAHEHSNINSTYHAVSSLRMLGFDVINMRDTLAFVRTCERSNGGFAVIPHGYEPYVEYTYYGVMALEALKEKCRFPAKTLDFLLRCQNANGGFARSDLGVSAFEYTFQAVSIVNKLALA